MRLITTSDSTDKTGGSRGQRIDKWLWHARFLSTRSRAAAYVSEGSVRLTRQGGVTERLTRPSQVVRPGDILTLRLGHKVRMVRVLDCAPRRGPPASVRALFDELDFNSAEM